MPYQKSGQHIYRQIVQKRFNSVVLIFSPFFKDFDQKKQKLYRGEFYLITDSLSRYYCGLNLNNETV